MAKLKNPYTFPHKSRRAKVDYICGIGGYWANRQARFPLEFTVGTYYADLDFDSIWGRIKKSGEWGDRKPDLVEFCAKDVYKEYSNDLWSYAVEDIWRSLNDGDTFRTLYDSGTSIDVTFGLYGRGGKHLCLESCEGITLKGLSEEDLEELLMTQSSPYGDDDVQDEDTLKKGWEWTIDSAVLNRFYRYVRQCEIDFTSKKASVEVEYYADDFVVQKTIELYDSLFGATEEDRQSTLSEAAKIVYKAIRAIDTQSAKALRTLCIAAGVDLESLAIPE